MINTNIEITTKSTVISKARLTASSKIAQLITALFLGIVLIFLVGFSPMDVAHNAAHDSRHSHAFPCH